MLGQRLTLLFASIRPKLWWWEFSRRNSRSMFTSITGSQPTASVNANSSSQLVQRFYCIHWGCVFVFGDLCLFLRMMTRRFVVYHSWVEMRHWMTLCSSGDLNMRKNEGWFRSGKRWNPLRNIYSYLWTSSMLIICPNRWVHEKTLVEARR